MEWGKGLVQKREREEKLLELQREASKPFARSGPIARALRTRLCWHLQHLHSWPWAGGGRWGGVAIGGFRFADDEDLNAAQRNAERWGDPMAAAAAAKRNAATVDRPKYRGPPPPPNRFNIPPGYRWDGVGGFPARVSL